MEQNFGAVNRLGDVRKDIGENPFEEVVSGENLDEFTEKAGHLAFQLNELESIVNDMQNCISHGVTDDSTEKIKQNIEKYTKLLRSIKPKFDELEKNVQKLKGDDKRPLEYNKHSHLLQNMSKALQNTMNRFDHMKESVSHLNRSKLERTLEINGIQATNEQIDSMMENQDFSMLDAVAEISKKKEALQALEEQHSVLVQLESAIVELSNLFYDLKLRTMENQEDLDRIETNYDQAVNYVSEGNTQIEKAIILKRSSSKKKIFIIAAVIFILAVIIVIIVMTTRK